MENIIKDLAKATRLIDEELGYMENGECMTECDTKQIAEASELLHDIKAKLKNLFPVSFSEADKTFTDILK